MGEYYKGHKLGTCSHLMYITREEVEYFAARAADEFDCLEDYLEPGFLYRFPREHDQALTLSHVDSREPFDYLKVSVPREFEMLHSDFAQVHMSTVDGGKVVVNMPFCPLSDKAAEAGLRPINYWPEIQIVGQQYTKEYFNGVTVFACPFCGHRFYCNEEECEVIREALEMRGYAWEAEQIKAYIEK